MDTTGHFGHSVKAVRYDGFYVSQAVAWEEWHAGARMHGERFHFRRFFSNRIWLGAYRDLPFEFWSDSEKLDSLAIDSIQRGHGPTDRDANPLWIAGTYEIEADQRKETHDTSVRPCCCN